MSKSRLVWSDEQGDLRKKKNVSISESVSTKNLILKMRRLTSGRGRTVIEITALPNNTKWCKNLAKELKKALGVGGTYKEGRIEIHGEKIDLVGELLDKKLIKWKKTGG